MARTYRLLVGPHDARIRLDRYLVRYLPKTLSRTAIQRLIQEGLVTVDSQPAKAHYLLKAGERVQAHCEELPPPSRKLTLLPEPIPLEAVYEDEAVLVVNKPAGLVTHPAPGHWTGTLVNAVLWHLQQAQGSGLKTEGSSLQPPASGLRPRLPRAGIVHRLDKDTSGLLLVAKTEPALRELSKQLKTRTMQRRYLALVAGHVPADEGTIEASIGRHATHRKVMAVRYVGGRHAVSHYRVLKRYGPRSTAWGKGRTGNSGGLAYSLVEVRLETGRTHQIRVHFAHLGHPVLGDPVYGGRSASQWAAYGMTRQLLHAYALRFRHPQTGLPVQLTAPVSPDIISWCGDLDLRKLLSLPR